MGEVSKLVDAWEARAVKASPTDAMIVRRHARELREALESDRAAQGGGVAVQLTVCCGREECGGECGNEWRGMEWVRTRPAAEAVGVPDDLVQQFPDGGAEHVLRIYLDLHASKIVGAHWLWALVERVAAGESADRALRDYGYSAAPSQPEGEAASG